MDSSWTVSSSPNEASIAPCVERVTGTTTCNVGIPRSERSPSSSVNQGGRRVSQVDEEPVEVQQLIDQYGEVWRPVPEDQMPREIGVMYDRADDGRCMTCGTPVGRTAIIIISHVGW